VSIGGGSLDFEGLFGGFDFGEFRVLDFCRKMIKIEKL
jgi:hypothetical protein